jgi:ADP-heptose:LPS heptosyltransferase
MRHEVERQLALVAAVGFRPPDDRLAFALSEADRAGAGQRLRAAGLTAGAAYFVIHPGASAPSRRYPADAFGRAADAIAGSSGATAVFTGADDERSLVEAARGCMTRPSVSLAGSLALGELAAVIEGSCLLVANNSGPVHIAAAVGTPVVDLYALTNPQHTPWKVPSRVLFHDVPCRWCLKSVCPEGHHACLRGVAHELVARAAGELLAEAASRCASG